ncbi:cellulase family glycosylhydrolase [Niabella aquatica]
MVFAECIGAGRANEGLRADWQQQLALVQKEIGFKYIRFHGLLHDDMDVYKEDKKTGEAIYNWQYVDKLFDFLLSIKMRPFVEFGFMPKDLASGSKTIFWWKGNVTKPKSYDKWNALIKNIVKHWQQRYGHEEIKNWYFEVWNEPDLKGFFDGTQEDYFELYANTARSVKSVSKEYRVGGPATSATKWIADFLNYCASDMLPLDFISTHDYGTTSVLDEFGTKKQQLKPAQDTITNNVKAVRKIINASAYPNAELHFTEWNSSPSSRDPIHDTYQNAAYILHVLKNASLYSNSLSYWTFTDIFEEAGPGPTPFHGGFGLMNLQGIKKPSYYAYKFLASLGNTVLENTDADSYACTNKDGVQLLIWNYTHPHKGYTYNQDYFNKIQPSHPKEKIAVRIKNITPGKYTLQVIKVGYKYNDPYTAYLEMGKPHILTINDVRALEKESAGTPAINKMITVTKTGYEQSLTLSENDIAYIRLIKSE